MRARCFKFGGSVEGIVSKTVSDQLLGIFAVDAAPLRLPVGSVRITLVGLLGQTSVGTEALVGHYTAPAKRLDDILFRAGDEAMRVGVLDTEDEVAAPLLGEEVVVECGAYSAHVERPGRGGGESYSGLFHILRIAGMFSRSEICSPAVTSNAGFCSGSKRKARRFSDEL